MLLSIIKLPGEPIVVITSDLPAEQFLHHAPAICRRMSAFLAEHPRLVRIVDLSRMQICVADIYLWLYQQTEGAPGTTCDRRVTTIIVGTDPVLQIVVNKAQRHLDVTIPCFGNVDDAIAHARARLCADQTTQP